MTDRRVDPERDLLEWSSEQEGKPKGFVSSLQRAVSRCAEEVAALSIKIDSHEQKDEERHAKVMRALGQHDAEIRASRDDITGITDVEELQVAARSQRSRAKKMKRAAVVSGVVTVVASIFAILRELGVVK